MKTLPLSLAALTLCAVNSLATGGRIEVLLDGSTLISGTSGIWTLSNPSGTLDVPAGTFGKAPSAPTQPPRQTAQGPNKGPAPLPTDPPKPLQPKTAPAAPAKPVDPNVVGLVNSVITLSNNLQKSALEEPAKEEFVRQAGAALVSAGCKGANGSFDCGKATPAGAAQAAGVMNKLSMTADFAARTAAANAAAKIAAEKAAVAQQLALEAQKAAAPSNNPFAVKTVNPAAAQAAKDAAAKAAAEAAVAQAAADKAAAAAPKPVVDKIAADAAAKAQADAARIAGEAAVKAAADKAAGEAAAKAQAAQAAAAQAAAVKAAEASAAKEQAAKAAAAIAEAKANADAAKLAMDKMMADAKATMAALQTNAAPDKAAAVKAAAAAKAAADAAMKISMDKFLLAGNLASAAQVQALTARMPTMTGKPSPAAVAEAQTAKAAADKAAGEAAAAKIAADAAQREYALAASKVAEIEAAEAAAAKAKTVAPKAVAPNIHYQNVSIPTNGNSTTPTGVEPIGTPPDLAKLKSLDLESAMLAVQASRGADLEAKFAAERAAADKAAAANAKVAADAAVKLALEKSVLAQQLAIAAQAQSVAASMPTLTGKPSAGAVAAAQAAKAAADKAAAEAAAAKTAADAAQNAYAAAAARVSNAAAIKAAEDKAMADKIAAAIEAAAKRTAAEQIASDAAKLKEANELRFKLLAEAEAKRAQAEADKAAAAKLGVISQVASVLGPPAAAVRGNYGAQFAQNAGGIKQAVATLNLTAATNEKLGAQMAHAAVTAGCPKYPADMVCAGVTAVSLDKANLELRAMETEIRALAAPPAKSAVDPLASQKKAVDTLIGAVVAQHQPVPVQLSKQILALENLKANNDKAYAGVATNIVAAAPILALYQADATKQIAEINRLAALLAPSKPAVVSPNDAAAAVKAAADKTAVTQIASSVSSAVNGALSAVGSLVKPGAPAAAAAKAADPKAVKEFLAGAQQAVTIVEKLKLPTDQAKPVAERIVNALRMAGCTSMTECPGANDASLKAGTAELKLVEPILAKIVADKSAAAKIDGGVIAQIGSATTESVSAMAKFGNAGASGAAAPLTAAPQAAPEPGQPLPVGTLVTATNGKATTPMVNGKPLVPGQVLPVGTVVDVTQGGAKLVVASEGVTATSQVFNGVFKVSQVSPNNAGEAGPMPVPETNLIKATSPTGTLTPTRQLDPVEAEEARILAAATAPEGLYAQLDLLKARLAKVNGRLEPYYTELMNKIEAQRFPHIDKGEVAALLKEVDAMAEQLRYAEANGSNIVLKDTSFGPSTVFYNSIDMFQYLRVPTPTPTPTPVPPSIVPNTSFPPPINPIAIPSAPKPIDPTALAQKACTDAMTDAAANKLVSPAPFIARCVTDGGLSGSLEGVSEHKATYFLAVKDATDAGKARGKLPDVYAPKLEKLNAKLDEAKLNKRARARLDDRAKAFSDSLKKDAKLTPEAAETRFDKLNELADEAIANAKERGSSAAGLEKRLGRMKKRLERQDPAVQKEYQAKLDAVVLSAGCRVSGEKLDCGEAPPAGLETAGEKLDALGEELGSARKAANAGKGPGEQYERKLGRLSRKLESPKLDAPAKAKIAALIEGFKKSLNDPARTLTAEQADEAFSKLSDDVDAASEKP